MKTVDDMNQEDTFIDSAASILKVLKYKDQEASNLIEIREIMKTEMGMKYKKVHPVSIHANC